MSYIPLIILRVIKIITSSMNDSKKNISYRTNWSLLIVQKKTILSWLLDEYRKKHFWSVQRYSPLDNSFWMSRITYDIESVPCLWNCFLFLKWMFFNLFRWNKLIQITYISLPSFQISWFQDYPHKDVQSWSNSFC